MNDKLLRDELKKLVANNNISITDNDDAYNVVINGVTISVSKTNTVVTRTNLITSR